MMGPTLKLKYDSLRTLLQGWAKVVFWETLLDIVFLCALPFLCLPHSHFPTIFLWEHFLINHTDTKSHLRICTWEIQLRHYFILYPVFLHQRTQFMRQKLLSYIDCLVHLFLIHISYKTVSTLRAGTLSFSLTSISSAPSIMFEPQ